MKPHKECIEKSKNRCFCIDDYIKEATRMTEDDINKIETLISYLEYLNGLVLTSTTDVISGCIEEANEWVQEIKER